MAIPIAAFTFTDDLARTVQFQDGSSGSPTSWQWDFGDSQTSTAQNPSHAYTADGVYKVKLIAHNADGDSVPIFYEIVVVYGVPVLPSVAQMIKLDLGDTITLTDNQIDAAIKNWMVMLGTVENLTDADIFKQEKYRAITRLLISRLIVYDQIVQKAQHGLIQMGSSGKGGLKAIETGPSRAEWYNETESWKQAIQEGGQVSLLTGMMCLLAAEVGITLPFCQPHKRIHLPKVYYNRHHWRRIWNS